MNCEAEEAEETDELDEFAKKLENEKAEQSQHSYIKQQMGQSQSPRYEMQESEEPNMRYAQVNNQQLEMIIQEESKEESRREMNQESQRTQNQQEPLKTEERQLFEINDQTESIDGMPRQWQSQNSRPQQNFEQLSFQRNNQQQFINPYVDMFAEKFQKSISIQSSDNQQTTELGGAREENAEIENSMQVLIKHYLVKNNSERQKNHPGGIDSSCISQRILNALVFNKKNKLLSVVDAGMTDMQLKFLLETIDQVISTLNGLKSKELAIKGLNLNGNTDLSDQGVKLITDFVIKTHSVMVLSIERLKCSHQSITYLFQSLPFTRIVELNVSGISINYFCIDALCKVIENNHKLDLRVLHLRNTKLNDSSALKLMTQVIERKSKVKYLSMSMNTALGFKFQQQVVLMLQKAVRINQKHNLRYLDLNFCNMSQANVQLVKKLVQYNNGELDQVESKKIRKALNSVNSNKSQKSASRLSRESQCINKKRENTKSNKRTGAPYLGRDITCGNFTSQRRSQAILNTGQSLQFSLNKLNPKNTNVNKSQNFEKNFPMQGIYQSATKFGQLSSINKSFGDSKNLISIQNQFPNDSIQEIIIQQDTNDQCGQNYQTIQSVNQQNYHKLGESESEMAKHLKFSKSCAPNQNKSKSLSSIIDDGVQRASAQPSQTLIENLNKLDLLNHLNGNKDVSSSQLVVESIQKLDLIKDLNTAYKVKEDTFESMNEEMRPRIFQMSSEGSRSRQNSKSPGKARMMQGQQTNEEYGQDLQEQFQMDQTFQKLNITGQRNNIQIQPETNQVEYNDGHENIDQPTEVTEIREQLIDHPPQIEIHHSHGGYYQISNDNSQVEQLNYNHSQEQMFQESMNEDLYNGEHEANYQTMPSYPMAQKMNSVSQLQTESYQSKPPQRSLQKPNRRTPSYQRRSCSDPRCKPRSQCSQQRLQNGKNRKRSLQEIQCGIDPIYNLRRRQSEKPGFTFSKSTKSLKNVNRRTSNNRSSGKTLSKQRLASRLENIQPSHLGTTNGKRYSMPLLTKSCTSGHNELNQQYYNQNNNAQNQSINLIIQEPLINNNEQNSSMLFNHDISMNSISSNWERTNQRTMRPPSICTSGLPYSSFASRRSSTNQSKAVKQSGKYIKNTNAHNKVHQNYQKEQLQKSLMPKQIHVQRINMNNRYLRSQNQKDDFGEYVAVEEFFEKGIHQRNQGEHNHMRKKSNASNNSQNSKKEMTKLTTTSSFPCLDYRLPKFIDQQDHTDSKIQFSGMQLPDGDTLHQINNLDLINQQRGPINSIQTTMPCSDLHSTRFRAGKHTTAHGTRNISRVSAADIKSQQIRDQRNQRRLQGGQTKGGQKRPLNAFNSHHVQEFIYSNQNQNLNPNKFQNGYRQYMEHNKENQNFDPGLMLNFLSNQDGIITGEAECLNGNSSKNFTERNELPPLNGQNIRGQLESLSNQYMVNQIQTPLTNVVNLSTTEMSKNERQLTEKVQALSQSQLPTSNHSQSQEQISTVDPKAKRLILRQGKAPGEGLAISCARQENMLMTNMNQMNQNMNSGKLLDLEAYEKDNTKSCSSKSAQISPISQTVINVRDRPGVPADDKDILQSNGIHQNDLKGNLKDMIQSEIQRLQALYQNIDLLLQERKPSHTNIRDPQIPASSSERQTLHGCNSGAGFATDNTGRSQISSDITSTTPYQKQRNIDSQYYRNVYQTKQNSNRYN